jgi:hypothetical protein
MRPPKESCAYFSAAMSLVLPHSNTGLGHLFSISAFYFPNVLWPMSLVLIHWLILLAQPTIVFVDHF